VRLSEVTIFELRGEWRRLHRTPPPMRLSRDLLIRGIIYQLQERAYGGLSTATARKLEQAAADPLGRAAVKPAPPISLKPGTRLVREWRGVTHMVLIHVDGIEWSGQRYHSLSVVAREITGARWSGPRFFGLRQRPRDSTSTARTGHGAG
jgi:Protein of unknown function (DUF2924)